MQLIQPISQNPTYDSVTEILRKTIALELEEIDKSDRINLSRLSINSLQSCYIA